MKTYEDLTEEQKKAYDFYKTEELKAEYLSSLVDEIPVEEITQSQQPAKVETIDQIIEQDPAKVAEVEEIKTNSANNQKRVNKKVIKKEEKEEGKSLLIPALCIGVIGFGLYKMFKGTKAQSTTERLKEVLTEEKTEKNNSTVEQKTEQVLTENTETQLGQFE